MGISVVTKTGEDKVNKMLNEGFIITCLKCGSTNIKHNLIEKDYRCFDATEYRFSCVDCGQEKDYNEYEDKKNNM